tara:strand:- start:3338 stop:3973 length:636 start_codon:yes stop_codon:yes gene_type:complete
VGSDASVLFLKASTSYCNRADNITMLRLLITYLIIQLYGSIIYGQPWASKTMLRIEELEEQLQETSYAPDFHRLWQIRAAELDHLKRTLKLRQRQRKLILSPWNQARQKYANLVNGSFNHRIECPVIRQSDAKERASGLDAVKELHHDCLIKPLHVTRATHDGLIVYSLEEQPTWSSLRDALEFYASSARRTYVRDRGEKAREILLEIVEH